MSKTVYAWNWPTLALWLLSGAAVLSGCVTNYHSPKPTVATLEIEIQGQWKKVQRVKYEYPPQPNEEK